MMYVLVLMLLAQIIFFYLLFDRNILSPTVIGTAMFFVSSLIALLYAPKWQTGISVHTTLVILSSLFVMGMGELMVHLVNYKRNQFAKVDLSGEQAIEVKRITVYGIIIVFSVLLLNYYRETVKLAEEAGYKQGSGALMLAYARIASLNENGKFSRRNSIAMYSYTLIKNIAYVFSYIFLYNKIICKKKHIAFEFLPVAIFIPYIILTTGRTEFIYLITVWIICGSVFYMQTKAWNPYYTGRIIRIGIFGIMFFLLVFVLVGSLKSTSLWENVFDSIAKYTGFSIPSLDIYFKNVPYPENTYFGEHTLFGIYAILKKFNASLPEFYAPWEFVNAYRVRGNVYTIIRRYHQDYGYFGLYFMMFFLGFFYSFLYLKFNNKRRNMGILFYAFIFSPIVEMSIEERFFMNVIKLSTLQSLFFTWFFFKVFVNNKGYLKKLMFVPAYGGAEINAGGGIDV